MCLYVYRTISNEVATCKHSKILEEFIRSGGMTDFHNVPRGHGSIV